MNKEQRKVIRKFETWQHKIFARNAKRGYVFFDLEKCQEIIKVQVKCRVLENCEMVIGYSQQFTFLIVKLVGFIVRTLMPLIQLFVKIPIQPCIIFLTQVLNGPAKIPTLS